MFRCPAHQPSRLLRHIAFAGCVLLSSCGGGGGSSPAPTTNPPANATPSALSVSALPRLSPYPTTPQQYLNVALEAFDMVYALGARGQMSTWRWSELEPTLGHYDASKFGDVDGAIAQARSHAMVQYVGIQLINTTARELPADLAGQAFDSAAVKARFHALLDRIVTPHRGQIKYLSIGNEVDAYLRAHPAEWASYKRFYADAVQYAHALDPSLQVGVTATADGALGSSTSDVQSLNEASDVIILTYYPLQYDASFNVSVRGPAVVAGDFSRMLQFAGSRPLLLQEVGYPASPDNLSSEAQQAQFVSNVFAAWRAADGRIPFLNFFLLHDFPQQTCDAFGTYYGLPNVPTFKAFLCSLGLRQVDGTPRQAWSTLVTEAQREPKP